MRKILDDIHLIAGIGEAHVFVLDSQNGFTLIDTGIFKKTHLLIAQLEQNGYSVKDLQMIVLTHCHCDHIGGVSELVKACGAKVAAQPEDIPYITQEKLISGAYRNMMIQEQKFMKQLGCNVTQVDIHLNGGDRLDILGGLQVIHVPGHTPGSIALYQPDRKIMFFGDVIRNHPKRGLEIGIPEDFNIDTEQTRRDARTLLDYPIEYALFSHGEPILGNAGRVIQQTVAGSF
jgi:glyoxylase-like metal-dependent hydrolase (beta-lactamase superfamily II)